MEYDNIAMGIIGTVAAYWLAACQGERRRLYRAASGLSGLICFLINPATADWLNGLRFQSFFSDSQVATLSFFFYSVVVLVLLRQCLNRISRRK